jgi:hypothetical protein
MSLIRRSGRTAAVLAGIVLAAAAAWPAAGAQASRARPVVGQLIDAYSVLHGVYCTSTANCWAVGFQGSAMKPEVNRVLHWNGRSWYRVSAPNPGGSTEDDESGLAAVRCLTAKNCWAVGHTYHNDIEKNQALHWNGKKWSVVRTPNPGGNKPGLSSQLFDVTCVTSSNCWAVGEFGNPSSSGKLFNEVLHWNGKHWSQVHVVNPGGTKSGDINELFSVRCGSARNCNAVGDYGRYVAPDRNEVLHWNGKRWSHVSAPNPAGTGSNSDNTLEALACSSATKCWAAGQASDSTIHNEILRWNGRSWTKASVPNPNAKTPFVADELLGAVCSSARNCWAVGQHGIQGSTAIMNEALHWNGKHWALVSTPNPGGTATANDSNKLLSVRCNSASNCWAVGQESSGGVYHQEILFWNGGKWSVY